MNIKIYKLLFATIVSLIVILNIGCENKEVNEYPTIRFLQPDSNLIIDKDTLISFVVEPFDKDGTIDRVEFRLNDNIVYTASTHPYNFDWSLKTEENLGNNRIKATAYDNDGASVTKEITIEVKSYLTKWLGTYEGFSNHKTQDPSHDPIWTEIIYTVKVFVEKSNQDSCLNLRMIYDNNIEDIKNDIKFSNYGTHYTKPLGGSSSYELNITFKSDSLIYYSVNFRGIYTYTRITFDIQKTQEKKSCIEYQ